MCDQGVGRDDSARDMDDVFEETARMEESEGRKQRRDRDQAIQESKRVAKSLDNCQWCLESKEMLKHLIVAIGNKVNCGSQGVDQTRDFETVVCYSKEGLKLVLICISLVCFKLMLVLCCSVTFVCLRTRV